jgi:lycopene beta-cyclase
MVEGVPIHSSYVFNSILFDKPVLSPKQFWLLQHFKGWMIETSEEVFDPLSATLMDFRTGQDHGTAFCYVLPFSSTRALVEYTVFSKEVLDPEMYDNRLQEYIGHVLNINSYEVLSQEFGVIPMTNFKFTTHQNNLVNIGTAGGQTKGSSGYTFNFIQKHSRAIVEQLMKSGKPFTHGDSLRFSFYDGILLNILYNQTLPGNEIFTRLFKKNPPEKVLKFLDNETSITEEIGIIRALPAGPFLQTAIWQLT